MAVTLGVNHSTARGIVARYIREGRIVHVEKDHAAAKTTC